MTTPRRNRKKSLPKSTQHHDTWHDDNGSSHIKALLLSPFITVPIVAGRMTLGPWQNLTLVECDTRDRVRDIVFQVMGE